MFHLIYTVYNKTDTTNTNIDKWTAWSNSQH